MVPLSCCSNVLPISEFAFLALCFCTKSTNRINSQHISKMFRCLFSKFVSPTNRWTPPKHATDVAATLGPRPPPAQHATIRWREGALTRCFLWSRRRPDCDWWLIRTFCPPQPSPLRPRGSRNGSSAQTLGSYLRLATFLRVHGGGRGGAAGV